MASMWTSALAIRPAKSRWRRAAKVRRQPGAAATPAGGRATGAASTGRGAALSMGAVYRPGRGAAACEADARARRLNQSQAEIRSGRVASGVQRASGARRCGGRTRRAFERAGAMAPRRGGGAGADVPGTDAARAGALARAVAAGAGLVGGPGRSLVG